MPTSDSTKSSPEIERKYRFAPESFTVVRLEDIDEVAHLRTDLINDYQPVNSQELLALERMATCQKAMLRSTRFEAGLFSACLNECLETDGSARFPLNEDITYGIEVTVAQNRNYMLADGFFRLARHSNGIQLFLRYQAQAERLYRRAVEEFERVKKLRGELPNEPISSPSVRPDGGAGASAPACQPSPRDRGSAGDPRPGTAGDLVAGALPNEPISSPPLRPDSGSAGDLVAGPETAPLGPPRAPAMAHYR